MTGPVTASAGVAHLDDTMSYGEALKAADLELYAAEAAGRNCCVADRSVYRARAARRDRGAARGAPIRLIALRAGAGR
ncbi:hypothetical protein [Methylobacterium currus]|uniref:hypothetical protein n=1 Tax=Methylobacterium currus TaxID=2051553 RepID=UPI001AECAF09|nr:hypothetical protein [Methylobacterium currus]